MKRKWLCCLFSKAKQWFRGFFSKKKGKQKGKDEFLEQYLFKIACFLSRNGSKHQLPSIFFIKTSLDLGFFTYICLGLGRQLYFYI